MDDLDAAAELAVEQLGVRRDERVAVLHNPPQADIAAALAQAARAVGARVDVLGFATLERHGVEPPEEVAAAIAGADACFAATDTSLSHTRARLAGTSRGGRFASLPTVTPDIFRRAIPVDYAEMTRRGAAIAALISQVDEVRITSPQGTDMRLVVRGRDGRNDDGDLRAPGAFGNLPAGEAYVAPVEVEGEGVLVFDGSVAGFGLLGEPMRVEVAGGRLVSASGEAGAWLEQVLDAGNGRSLAELGIGTNPAASLCGVVLEDEKIMGTAHVAFGSSAGIGGVVQSSVHVDSVMLEPTIEIAGRTVVSGGKLLV
jgi:leucyl aminopeptidase (aminopeptidase T)